MKKLKLKKKWKWLLLGIFDSIVILNLPLIIKNTTDLNNYRFNIIILAIFFTINFISIIKIESK